MSETAEVAAWGNDGGRSAPLAFTAVRQHDLLHYWQSVWRRKWIALGVLAAAVIASLLYSFSQPTLFRATTTIEIARESARVLDQKDTETQGAVSGAEFYQTQYGLLKSRSLAERVARELRLADNEAFLNGFGGSTDMAATPRRQREERAIGLLARNLQIVPTRNSGLVDISVDSPDPALSSRLANTMAQDFIKANLQRRFDANSYARNFLERELENTRRKLEQSERDVVNYAAGRQIIELGRGTNEAGRTTAGQSLSETDLDILNRKLAEARADRITAQAQMEAQRRAGAAASASLADPAITQARARRSELEGEYSKNLATLKPDYPSMVALRQQIDQLSTQINQQAGTVGRGVQSRYEAAKTIEDRLAAQVASLRGDVIGLGRDRIQYNIYQREADTNRALYDSLLERYKEIGVAGSIGTNNVAVVDPALPPGAPFTPRPLLNLLVALVLGGLIGIAAALIIDQLDDAIRSPADVEQAIGAPILGIIPRIPDGDRFEQLSDAKSLLSESVSATQMSLRFATDHGVPKSMVLTSANPNEGKTTASLALAAVLAKLGNKVVLVDGDMRNPSIHKMIGTDNAYGLSDVLSGGRQTQDVVRGSQVPNLSIVTSGPIPPNPAELLSAGNLHRLTDHLLEQFDHVIFDAPPVIGLSDSPAIASTTEATIFVISAGQTHARSAVASLRRLMGVNANVLGCLLTKFDQADSGYGYNYNYHYSS